MLVLLMVTPQVLLRPCCCTRQRADAVASADGHENFAALPPCCQKRLEAAQKAKSLANASTAQLPGLHDSGRCACRIHTDVARTNRTHFKVEALRHLDAGIVAQVADSERQAMPYTEALASGYASPPDWGAVDPARLCRWVV
jgi:hypothetical protein